MKDLFEGYEKLVRPELEIPNVIEDVNKMFTIEDEKPNVEPEVKPEVKPEVIEKIVEKEVKPDFKLTVDDYKGIAKEIAILMKGDSEDGDK